MNKHQKLVQQQFLNNEKKVIDRLEWVYKRSQKDVNDKIKNLQFKIDDLQQTYDWMDDNDPEKAKIKSMIQSKIYQKQYQEQLKSQIDGILNEMQTKQFLTVSDYLDTCYTDGFVGTIFDAHGQGVPIITPIDQQSLVRAVQLDSKISKGLYTRLGEDVTKLKKRIASHVSRGISSGMSYGEVANALAGLSKFGYNNAIRIARTEGHRIQTTAAMDAMTAAKDMGADVVKQWDSTLDDVTRESHRIVDGEIRELDKPFSNGLDFPGDPAGGAAEVINCRCALLQRARWALDDDELQTLKDRAAYYGLDKTANFEDFKQKYLNAVQTPAVKPKKEYLTEKKLKQKIADLDSEIQTLESKYGGDISLASPDDKAKYDDFVAMKTDYQTKLDDKIIKKETKKLTKEQIQLQDQIDNFQIDTYSGIWKDDVTTADWASKQSAISKKKDYFEDKLKNATDQAEIDKWQSLLDSLDDFDTKGKEYNDLQSQMRKVKADLKNLQNRGIMKDDPFTQDRKDAAYWFTDQNGSVKAADAVLRDKSGEVWRNANTLEKDSIYEYTRSYHKYNEPLRGIEYGTNKFLGVGNVDLDQIGVTYGGFKPGQIHSEIDAITSIIDQSTYDFDIWVQRGCRRSGMDKFFNINPSDFDLPEADLSALLVGTTPTEYAFMSTGVAKGKGLNTSGGVLLNIYAPSGTKMMYVEPISAFGYGDGRSWDGVASQATFGHEAEMLMQRGTRFRVTKVEKSNGTIFVDMEVIEQGVQ